MRTKILMTMLFVCATAHLWAQAEPGFEDSMSKVGVASWYAEFSPGINETTANMEIFDSSQLTCAIWDVPFDTMIRVTNLENAKSIVVRVNDRGPAKRLVREGRIIDLTREAFARIADLGEGLIKVRIEIMEIDGSA